MTDLPSTTITVETIPVISYQGVRVLTTDLLAQSYGATAKNILDNFSNNSDRFEAGKHYFKLEGDALKEFKRLGIPDDIGDAYKFTARLILWTARGAARHAKILDTDQAWTVFEQLEDSYFNPREASQASVKAADPIIGALVHGLMEIDSIKQQNALLLQHQAALSRQTEILEHRVQNVELQHRNGVPDGHLSKKQAHHLYGEGLSEEIFHLALAKIGVSIKNYIHRGDDGYEAATFAYLDSEIPAAVERFLSDARQCTPQMCQSPMLGGKRFRYVKQDGVAA